MKPTPNSQPELAPILAFGAHPDDIEFGCGGVIAVEFEELERRTEQRRTPLGLERPPGGSAMRRRLAPRADDQVRRPACASLQRDDTAAAELDVVGVGAECQKRRNFMLS